MLDTLRPAVRIGGDEVPEQVGRESLLRLEEVDRHSERLCPVSFCSPSGSPRSPR